MILGITGSRHGCTDAAMETLISVMDQLKYDDGAVCLHHGDCLGVDIAGAVIADELQMETICHPPISDYMRAFHNSSRYMLPKEYKERDRAIVDACDLLIVVPDSNVYNHRRGTWYTYKYAEKIGRDYLIIYPDGSSSVVGPLSTS